MGKNENLMQDLFGDDSDSDDDAPAVKDEAAKGEADDDDADDESEEEIAVAKPKKKSKKAADRARRGKKEKGAKRDISAEEKASWDKVVGGGDSDDDAEPVRTAADDAFIDDTDVAPEDRYGDDGDRSPSASEAEEDDDDLEKLFGSKPSGRGRARQSEQAITSEVLNFLARMEVATEQDRESVVAKQPAVQKLRMLKEMTTKLKEVDLHESFLRHGLLKVLASWLNLLPDGNLPNVTVRTAVIEAIRQLPIETDLTDRRGGAQAIGPRPHHHVPLHPPSRDPGQPQEVQGSGGEVESPRVRALVAVSRPATDYGGRPG